MEKWERILEPSNVLVDLKAQRNFDAIRELASVLADDGAVRDRDRRGCARLERREASAAARPRAERRGGRAGRPAQGQHLSAKVGASQL